MGLLLIVLSVMLVAAVCVMATLLKRITDLHAACDFIDCERAGLSARVDQLNHQLATIGPENSRLARNLELSKAAALDLAARVDRLNATVQSFRRLAAEAAEPQER